MLDKFTNKDQVRDNDESASDSPLRQRFLRDLHGDVHVLCSGASIRCAISCHC
jgi:hypothetical protein